MASPAEKRKRPPRKPARSGSAPAPPPSDWLAEHAQKVGLDDAALRSIRAWLAEQLVADEPAKLGQGGHTEDRVPLRRVFVDLPITRQPAMEADSGGGGDLFLKGLMAAEPMPLAWYHGSAELEEVESTEGVLFERLTARSPQPGRGPAARSPQPGRGPGDQLENAGVPAGTLLIGGPGQGKSTLGQLACQLHRAALLRPRAAELPTHVRDVLHPFESAEDEELALPEEPLFPIKIVLPEAIAWLVKQAEASEGDAISPPLLQFLAAQPSGRKAKLQAGSLATLLAGMPFLLLLDGFDEVGAAEDREQIVTIVRELVTELGQKNAHAVVVATTRPQGYTGELARIGVPLATRYLAPLGTERALRYAAKLVEAHIRGADKQATILERLRTAAKEPATARLFQTPLQVTILAALVRQGRAPNERWSLFRTYFDFLYRREIDRDSYASALLAARRAHITAVHLRVALLLQVEAENAGGAAARMSRERLQSVVDTVLKEDEIADSERAELVQQIVDAAEKRLVLLVEPEPGSFGFEIRSLQEFMAAWALSEGRDVFIQGRLLQVAKAPLFRNVVLFIASKLFSERSALRDTLADGVCGALEEDASDPLARATRAGALLALDMLEEGSALGQPKRARALMERAAGLLDLPPGPEHARLARIASDDTAPVLQAAIESRLTRGSNEGSAPSLAAWATIVEATNFGQVWAKQVGDACWPLLKEPERVLDACRRGGVPLGRWIVSKIEAAPEVFSPESQLGMGIDFRDPAESPKLGPVSTLLFRITSFASSEHIQSPDGWSFVVPLLPNKSEGFLKAWMRRLVFPLANMQSPPPRWHAWVAAAKFVLEPAPALLAETLLTAADTLKRESWTRLADFMPWPLAACLRAAETVADLRRTADMLTRGELGGAAEWYCAQQSWEGGTSLRAAIGAVAEGVPWTLDSLAEAPPLLATRNVQEPAERTQNAMALLRLAARAFDAARSTGQRARLAGICFHLFSCLPNVATDSSFPVSRWAEAVDEPPDWLIPRPAPISEREWMKTIDVFGARRLAGRSRSHEAVMNVCSLHPQSPGVLHWTMANLTERKASSTPPDLRARLKAVLLAQSYADPAERAFAAILRVWLGGMTAGDASTALEQVAAQTEKEPQLWHRFRRAVQTGDLPPSLRESLLLRCHEKVGTRADLARPVLDAMRAALQSRRSGLGSPATWDRLELPLPYPMVPAATARLAALPNKPVALRKLHVQHLRVLGDLELDFEPPPPDQGQWIVLLGANGVGKTTLLRSLVLALRNLKDPKIWPRGTFATPWHANGGPGEARIKVDVVDHGEQITRIRSNGSETFSQSPEQETPRLFPLFAYGCRRGSALGGSAREVDLGDDDGPEVATLFDEGAPLIHAETWLIQWDGDAQKNERSRHVFDTVRTALSKLLDLETIEVRDQKVWVTGRVVGRVELRSLSDGYVTTAGWFLDLLARWIKLADRHGVALDAHFMERMTGLVLLDEIDLHLHPRWQVDAISRVRALLPRMSFVVTTHNPLTLVGAKPEEIRILSMENGKVRAESGTESPMLLTGGQIYSRYFGIQDIYPNELGRKLRRYSFLSGYALRDDEEQAEMVGLRDELRAAGIDPGWEEVPREPLPGVEPRQPPPRKPRKKAPRKAS